MSHKVTVFTTASDRYDWEAWTSSKATEFVDHLNKPYREVTIDAEHYHGQTERYRSGGNVAVLSPVDFHVLKDEGYYVREKGAAA